MVTALLDKPKDGTDAPSPTLHFPENQSHNTVEKGVPGMYYKLKLSHALINNVKMSAVMNLQ